jgi:hypothetical protein
MDARVNDECNYGVLAVTIDAVTARTVTFRARSASKTGDANECLLRQYTVPLEQIYVKPIAGAPDAVPLMPGASGNLFLSREGWQTLDDEGFGIYGIDHASFKWPLCGAAPSRVLSALHVVPTSIVVHGHLEGGDTFFELELLGPDAATSQSMTWDGANHVEIRLSPSGAAKLGVAAGATVATVWPTRILVRGAPAFDPVVHGVVDLLNHELAGEHQRLVFAAHGAPIALSLTQDGVNEFHVTPQAVAEFADATERRLSRLG